MKIIKQIFTILLFYVIGEIISSLLKNLIFIPGTIIGMLLLIFFLVTKVVKLDQVEDVGGFLTSNMAFFFIPTVVSVIEYFDVLEPIIFKVLIVCFFSATLTFLVTVGVVKLLVNFQDKLNQEYQDETSI